jgi:hypothetical protein
MAIQRFLISTAAIAACAAAAAGYAAFAMQAQSRQSKTDKTPPASRKASATKEETNSILSNGGFERGASGASAPESWKTGAAIPGVGYHWDKTVAHRGRASLHLKKTAQRYFPIAQCFQEVKREGKLPRLKVGAFVRANKITKAILDVQFIAGRGESHQWAA